MKRLRIFAIAVLLLGYAAAFLGGYYYGRLEGFADGAYQGASQSYWRSK